MALLDDLPYETLFNIFSTLSCSDLYSVSIVSRRWHVISEPILYREPDIYWEPCQRRRRGTHTNPTAIQLFLRTLLIPGCERLASHVRQIYLHWWDYTIDLTPRRRSDTAIITAAESRFGVPHSSVPGSNDSHAVLLMHLLPRLQSLEVIPRGVQDSFDDFLLSIGPTEPLPLSFQSLTNFSCGWHNTDVGVSPRALVALLQLPHMRTVDVNVCGEIDDLVPADVRGTSGVTRLTLGYGEISASLIGFILSVPRALECFFYYGSCVDGFVVVLRQLRTTLTHLHLQLGDEDYVPEQTLSLREWPVLVKVTCPLGLLLVRSGPIDGQRLAEKLPACIRQLHLIGWRCYSEDCWSDEEEVEPVIQLVGEKERMLPVLERLETYIETHWTMISPPTGRDPPGVAQSERLHAGCEAAGVKLVLNTNTDWNV